MAAAGCRYHGAAFQCAPHRLWVRGASESPGNVPDVRLCQSRHHESAAVLDDRSAASSGSCSTARSSCSKPSTLSRGRSSTRKPPKQDASEHSTPSLTSVIRSWGNRHGDSIHQGQRLLNSSGGGQTAFSASGMRNRTQRFEGTARTAERLGEVCPGPVDVPNELGVCGLNSDSSHSPVRSAASRLRVRTASHRSKRHGRDAP